MLNMMSGKKVPDGVYAFEHMQRCLSKKTSPWLYPDMLTSLFVHYGVPLHSEVIV